MLTSVRRLILTSCVRQVKCRGQRYQAVRKDKRNTQRCTKTFLDISPVATGVAVAVCSAARRIVGSLSWPTDGV